MKKYFNPRRIVLYGILVAVGVLTAFLEWGKLPSILCLGVVLIAFLGVLLLLINKKILLKYLFTYIFSLMFFMVSFCSASICYKNLMQSKYINQTEQTIIAKIDSVKHNGVIYLTDVNINGKNYSGEVQMFYNGDKQITEFKFGECVELNTTFYTTFTNIFKNGSCIGRVYVSDSDIISKTEPKSILAKLRNYITDVVIKGDTSEYGGSIMVAMLFGDRAYLQEITYDSFSSTGVMHVLAVSGLHIGFLLLAINFILKKIFKNNTKSIFIIESIILILYMIICNFTASVVRAVVVGIISLYADFKGKQYDGLNALSLATIILLLISPTMLVDVGFQLSFGCVFTIICLMPMTSELLCKIMPTKLANSLALTIVAWIGTLPLLLYVFGRASVLTILINLIVLPLVSFVFIITFIFAIISSILPLFSFIMVVPGFLFDIFARVIMYINSSSVGIINLVVPFATMVIAYLCIALVSDFSFIKTKHKRFITIVALFAIIIIQLKGVLIV